MTDTSKLLQLFKARFEEMSYEEREKYLLRMGFSFGNHISEFKLPRAGLKATRQIKRKSKSHLHDTCARAGHAYPKKDTVVKKKG